MYININYDHMIVHEEWCVVHYELHSHPCKHTITFIHTMSLYNTYIYMKYEEVTHIPKLVSGYTSQIIHNLCLYSYSDTGYG
jgi:hypothetical protein